MERKKWLKSVDPWFFGNDPKMSALRTVGARTLLYGGRSLNVVVSQRAEPRIWFGLDTVVHALQTGHRVLYISYETSRRQVMDCLVSLLGGDAKKARDLVLAERFAYQEAQEFRWNHEARDHCRRWVAEFTGPKLVVVESTTDFKRVRDMLYLRGEDVTFLLVCSPSVGEEYNREDLRLALYPDLSKGWELFGSVCVLKDRRGDVGFPGEYVASYQWEPKRSNARWDGSPKSTSGFFVTEFSRVPRGY